MLFKSSALPELPSTNLYFNISSITNILKYTYNYIYISNKRGNKMLNGNLHSPDITQETCNIIEMVIIYQLTLHIVNYDTI